jgi:hydrogenase maturation protease
MKTLILGLGNPILTDDAVGIEVVKKIAEKNHFTDVEIREASIAGLAILDEIDGFDRVIIVDSIKTGKNKPGTIMKLDRDKFNTTTQLSYSHGIDYFTAIELGRRCGVRIPELIEIYAVEIEDNLTFSEDCTPNVKGSIPVLAELIIGRVG